MPTLTRRTLWLVAVSAIHLAPGNLLRAQGTAVVPATDIVYRDLDRLAELGLLDSVIVGQRPHSRRELVRIAELVRAALDRGNDPAHATAFSEAVGRQAGAIAQRLDDRFGANIEALRRERGFFVPVDGASLTVTSTNAERRGFTPGVAEDLEATIDPLARRRLGEPAVLGQSYALELAQRAEPVTWLAIQARERFEHRAPRDSALARDRAELLLASVRARYRNVALTVGRAQYAWAQGDEDGIFLASDAPALDQISLAGDRPFLLPGVLSRLGPTQATLIYADLGRSIARSHSRLVAYKVSVKPARSLELGGTFMNHFGGAGGKPSSFGNRLIDLLPFIDIFRKHQYDPVTGTDVDSDKLIGVDGRWRVARLGGLLLTGELMIDDFDVRRIPYLLTGYGSSMVGVTLPSLGSPAWSMKLSAKHMGILTYTHGALLNGITTRGRLLGDELGPDAKAFGAELRWQPEGAIRATLDGRSALYSEARYTASYADADSIIYRVNKIYSGPNELRDRVRATLELHEGEGLVFVARAGVERIRNAFFLDPRRMRYAADVSLRLGL